MSEKRHWTGLVLEATRNLGADAELFALKDIYNAVKGLSPLVSNDSDVYIPTCKGRAVREPRWRRNARRTFSKLRRKGLVTNKGGGS
ncbi:MAG: hypothetical protein LM590_12060 [Thermofilum sp.]|nr:hypothetical protein [Thermofilum sp.]